MPHIVIKMYPGRDESTKRSLALKMQEVLAQELKVDKGIVSVSVEDIPQENWTGEMDKLDPATVLIPPGK